MHPKLSDYITRFKTDQKKTIQAEFFTQLDISDYKSQLPFLYEVDNFCIRLLEAKLNSQKICIYSDYDTDAVTATATMYWGLIELGFLESNLDFYAPDRFSEGYGMNTEAAYTLSQKHDLIISVDCGINSTEEASIIADSPADLLITDHHHLRDEIPKALAVLNPRVGERFGVDTSTRETRLNFSKQVFQDLLSRLDVSTDQLRAIENWKKDLDKLPKNLMSTSVTGVGVAWFSLVWLAYFFEETVRG